MEKEVELWAKHPLRTARNHPVRRSLEGELRSGFVENAYGVGSSWRFSGYVAKEPFGRGAFSLGFRKIELVSDGLYWSDEASLVESVKALLRVKVDVLRFRYFREPMALGVSGLQKALESLGCVVELKESDPVFIFNFEEKAPSELRSKSTRKNERRHSARLESDFGAIRLGVFDSECNVDEFFRVIETVNHGSWQYRRELNVLRDDETYRRIVASEMNAGRFRSYVLYAGDRPVSYQFGTVYLNRYYCEKTAFDEHFAEYSVGALLRSLYLDDLFSSKIQGADFGIGMSDYKASLSNVSPQTWMINVYPPRLSSRMIFFSESLKTGLRNVLRK